MEDLSKVIRGTGSYATVKSGNMVSITGDGGEAWGFHGQKYLKLAPRWITYQKYAAQLEKLIILEKNPYKLKQYLEFRRQIEDEYIQSYYETRLKDLDVRELLITLRKKFGEGIILLCHEPVEEFCHRRVVADDIKIQTGIYIPEIGVDEFGNETEYKPISYEERLLKLIKGDLI